MADKIISSEKDVKNKNENANVKKANGNTKKPATKAKAKVDAEVVKEETINKEIEEMKTLIDKLQEESKKKDEQIEKFMQLMVNGNQQNNGVRQITADDIIYIVTTNMVTGVDLTSPNGDVSVRIQNGELVDVTERDLREIFRKKGNKVLFENNVCSFIDEDTEEVKADPLSLFRIKVKVDLSDENILSILNERDANILTNRLNEITDDKTNIDVVHTLFHKICQLDVDGKLVGLPRVTYDIIEKYFNVSISRGIINLGIYKNVPRP